MSYLTQISPTTAPQTADDFNCGWSVIRMLTQLSLQSASPVETRRAPAARMLRAAMPVAGPCDLADSEQQ